MCCECNSRPYDEVMRPGFIVRIENKVSGLFDAAAHSRSRELLISSGFSANKNSIVENLVPDSMQR